MPQKSEDDIRWTPRSTVATVIEKDGRFLLVEELSQGQRVLNQPAGHLEQGETLIQAAAREVMEETAWRVEIDAYLGIYVYHAPANGLTYHRHAFIGTALEHTGNALDPDILNTHWLGYEELQAPDMQLRSPMVMAAIEDFRRGVRYPLNVIHE